MWEDRFSDRICSEISEIYSHTSVIAPHIIIITFYALENSKKPNMKKIRESPPPKNENSHIFIPYKFLCTIIHVSMNFKAVVSFFKKISTLFGFVLVLFRDHHEMKSDVTYLWDITYELWIWWFFMTEY